MIKVGIVILNWNRKDDTVACLNSLDRLRVPLEHELKIYLVDNGSTDDSLKAFSKITSPSFRLIENKINLGYVGGNNIGVKEAISEGCDWVLILNNDTLVDRGLVTNFVKFFHGNKDVEIVSPKIYFAPGYEFHKDRYPKALQGRVVWYAGGMIDWKNCYATNFGVDDVDRGQYDAEREIDFATGTAMLVRSQVFEKIGFFDERYYMYFEDVDFSLRAKKAGFKIIYFPKSFLWHKVAQSSEIGSNLNDYFITRNRMLFGFKYVSFRTKLSLIKESLKFLFIGRNWQKIGIKDFYLGRFGKGSWK